MLLGIQVPFGTDKQLLDVIQVKALSNPRLGGAPDSPKRGLSHKRLRGARQSSQCRA